VISLLVGWVGRTRVGMYSASLRSMRPFGIHELSHGKIESKGIYTC